MILFYKFLLTSLLLLQIHSEFTLAKPTTRKYNNATLQLAKGTQMATYMNLDADPCDDFYDWACGKWPLSHPASATKDKTSFVKLLEDLYKQKCVDALEQSSDNITSDDAAVFFLDNMLKTIYASCQNTFAMKIAGFAPIWHALEFHSNWPLISDTDWFDIEYDWLKLVALAKRKFNTEVFVGFNVVNNLQHPESKRIQLGAPKLTLNDTRMYLAAEHAAARDDYRSYIERKLELFFPAMSKVWSHEIASQVLQVETKLAQAITNRTNEVTPLERYVAELKVSYGNYVDLSRYLQLLLDRQINDKVYETPKGYFKSLVDIVKLTPKLTLANYTLWKVLDQFDMGGDKLFCLHKLMNIFPHEIEYLFYRSYKDTDLEQALQTTFVNIKNKLYDELQYSKRFQWILQQSLKHIRDKLRSMRLEIAQPQDHIIFFHGAVRPSHMRADQYFNNIINILEWQNMMQLLKLHPTVTVLSTPPNSQLLPSYNSQTNTIQIPVIFMQPYFFTDPTYPSGIEHGTFTFLLAQQIFYGLSYDDSDTDANKIWDIASELRFTKRSSCFAQQSHYSAKEFRKSNVTDRQRLKKAIIDNGGLALAYRMYEQQNDFKMLPRLPNSPMQQFFLAYAQLFCADYADVVAEYADLPEALRVNGAVSNLKEFSKEFKCSDTSNLNPKETCLIF
ncbi:phosphate-regulating neutral endopeptidase PHEX-like [Eurosta solidaginis]|uniref:phosphate-regulating neutral endopeptidase PHEX-like n=1 Tax=Eurosta solidaginis TaxID=178769 RepID=UPI003531333D